MRGPLIQVVGELGEAGSTPTARRPREAARPCGLTAFGQLLVNFDPFLASGVVFHQRQLFLSEGGVSGRRKNHRAIDARNAGQFFVRIAQDRVVSRLRLFNDVSERHDSLITHLGRLGRLFIVLLPVGARELLVQIVGMKLGRYKGADDTISGRPAKFENVLSEQVSDSPSTSSCSPDVFSI